MIILGLNAYHGDSAACLVVDGKLVCAMEEERIRRQKHWAGLPAEAVKWCLDYAHLEFKDVDYIAIGRNPFAHLDKKLFKLMSKRPSLSFVRGRLSNASKVGDIKTELCKALGADKHLIKAKVKNIEHHRAHLASSYFVSPFKRAVCVSVDGFGDFVSTMRGLGAGNKLTVKDAVYYPHSLGIFYTALTQYLGFPHYGDEYKVMGLSAMGKPVYMAEMRKIVKLKPNGLFELDSAYFTHDSKGVEMTWSEGSPSIAPIFADKLNDLLGKLRGKDEPVTDHHANIAASMQAMYEEAFFNLLNKTYDKYKVPNLCLSGGCIQNSLANGRIFEKTKFKEVYIPPAAYDAGTAVGAAYWLWNETLGHPRTYVMDRPYLGPEYNDAEIEKVLNEKGVTYAKLTDDELFTVFAKAVADGKITGWFQGRTEWGPRALGNRSIVVDPRRAEMKDILNARVKRRENFRPFAPSILAEAAGEWFDAPYPVPFMEKVYMIKEDKRKLIPAVTHLDGTGRLQTVTEAMNPRYHRLIKTFEKLTGVPIVLNTSFNENEPIVNTPGQAIDCFQRVGMDLLAIGNYLVASLNKSTGKL
ncbi:MAG: carbamoyltransferase C-terminal domain-containing protein [Elusimicrobiota bacterium]|nr:carbamoyltransferase C-terminal domain-containing protein [Elusimicrobiota bacterium]